MTEDNAAPRPHTDDDALAFWLKNKGEFSEQPWLNFLARTAANTEALDLVRRLRSEVESEAEHGEPRVCAWCNERVKQGEPCVNSPSGQVGGAYRYFHEWCYGLHEHQRAEAAEAKLAELREAAQYVVDRLLAKEPHELDYSHLLSVLGRGLPKGRASEPPLD